MVTPHDAAGLKAWQMVGGELAVLRARLLHAVKSLIVQAALALDLLDCLEGRVITLIVVVHEAALVEVWLAVKGLLDRVEVSAKDGNAALSIVRFEFELWQTALAHGAAVPRDEGAVLEASANAQIEQC